MFKKTLLALALTGLSGVANAAEFTPTSANKVSVEGSLGAASVAAPSAFLELGAEYSIGDTVTFSIAGATIDTDESTVGLTQATSKSDASTPGAPAIQFGLLSTDGSKAVFRVTSVADGVATTGKFVVLEGVKLATSSVSSAGKATISFAAATSTGLAIDTGTKATTLVTKVAQLESEVTKKLNAVIDVENERKQFTVGNDTITTDTLVIAPELADADILAATYTGGKYVIKGDFSWMEADGEAGISAAELADAFSVVGGLPNADTPVAAEDSYTSEINEAGTEITVTVVEDSIPSGTVENVNATFTVLGKSDEDAPILSSQAYTVDSTLNFETAAGKASETDVTSEAAGSWTLNGFDEDIVFMPFASQYAQSITVSNTGLIDGAITVDITANGKTYTKTLTATAAPKATTDISAEVKAFAVESSVMGNAHIKVVVNSPKADIEVAGVYYSKADADRVKTK